MKKFTQLKLMSAAVPYVAVLIGLYVFRNAWIAIGLYHFGIAVFLIVGNRDRLLKRIRSGWNPVMAVSSVVMSVMIFPVIFFFWEYMQLENVHLNTSLAGFGLHGTSWFFFMIYFSSVHPFLEELYWRGYLESNHNKHFSWTDFAFAGYHILVLTWFIKLPWLVIAFFVLTAAAYCWRYAASKLEGLVVPLLSHIIADVSIIAAANVLVKQ